MNEALENLYARRSIRKFTDEPVTDEQLHQLLKAAMCAPTAANTQCWHFVIMRDPAAREAIVKVHPNGRPLLGADLGIVILADLDREKAPGYFPGDCGAAAQNILLAAQAQGLGAVWLGIYPMQERVDALSQILKLPKNIVPFCIIAVGNPAESKVPNDRYLADRVHEDVW